MEYKEMARDAKIIAESFRQDGNVILPNRLEMYSTAITDLLSRAEAAEKRADRWEEEVKAYSESDLAKAHDLLSADWAKQKIRADAAEARAEKAEKLIDWIYSEAEISVEHNMRMYFDWLKEKIEEWRGQKEE